MKKIISAALVVAMTAVSCANKEDLGNNNAPEQPSADGTMSFSADFAEPISKAAPSYNETSHVANVLWEAQDKVGVYDKDGAPAEFTAQTAGESTTLTGFAQPDVATYYAMYPYDENATISGGIISTSLPAEQKAAAEAFTAHLAVASTEDNSFSFSNVCGLVRIYVGCEHVTKVEFKGNNNEVVAGDIQVNAATAGYENGAATAKTITVLPPADAQTFAKGAYYFSILPQNFQSGFTVTSYTNDGYTEVRKVDDPVNIPRSSLVVGKPFTDISGTGAEDDPFVIKTVHDLCNLSEELSLERANYVELANDIDMAGVTEWTPINNSRVVEEIAEIHFEGNNHTISNFAPTTIEKGPDGKTNYSLLGSLYGSCKNLTIMNANIDHSESSTTAILAAFGGVAGKDDEIPTLIENVHVSGAVNATKVVGGLVGQAVNLTVENCSVDVEVKCADDDCASLIGRAAGGAILIEECQLDGSVVCSKNNNLCYGGFIGNSETSVASLIMKRCCSDVDVIGDYQVGGLIGVVNGTNTIVTIEDCFSTGDLSSMEAPVCGKQFGGIMGTSKAKELTIQRCWYSGSISAEVGTGTSNSNKKNMVVGGILGLNAGSSTVNINISNCFVVSTTINADKDCVGGIVGSHLDGTLAVENSYAQATIQCDLGSAKIGWAVGQVAGTSTIKNCKHNTDLNATVGSGTATEEGNSKLTAEQVSAYATPSAVATQLGWASVLDDQGNAVWDLTGNAPTLRCFE